MLDNPNSDFPTVFCIRQTSNTLSAFLIRKTVYDTKSSNSSEVVLLAAHIPVALSICKKVCHIVVPNSVIFWHQIVSHIANRYCHTLAPNSVIFWHQIVSHIANRYCHILAPNSVTFWHQIVSHIGTRYCQTLAPNSVIFWHQIVPYSGTK